jgi:rod shape-determining protein MreC
MDNLLSRHRNLTVLVVVLFVQVVGLAVQVKRPTESGSTRLLRLWAVTALTPFEKAVVHTQEWAHNAWRNYFYLRDVRRENQALRDEIQRMRLEQVRLEEDAGQARRLQALLGFKEQFIQQTLPAQVISTTGSEFSRGIYIDKGAHDGVQADMPVITPDGIVGKVYRAYPTSSLVLLIHDPSSGAGVILEKSRLQGILRGNAGGETIVHNIMTDEQVQAGERVLTSGGDRIYPKGLPVGVVSSVAPGADFFLTVRVKPAAQLNRLEEVLVITKIVEKAPETDDLGPRQRAADILAERLPTVPPKTGEAKPAVLGAASPSPAGATNPKPGATRPQTPSGTVPLLQAAPAATPAAGAMKPAPTAAPGKPKPATSAPPHAAKKTSDTAKPDAAKPSNPPPEERRD